MSTSKQVSLPASHGQVPVDLPLLHQALAIGRLMQVVLHAGRGIRHFEVGGATTAVLYCCYCLSHR
jgi:hypothetical protein